MIKGTFVSLPCVCACACVWSRGIPEGQEAHAGGPGEPTWGPHQHQRPVHHVDQSTTWTRPRL